jgi:hypothetical protein
MMDRQQQWDRMMALSEEGEHRGRAASKTGSVSLNKYLTSEEQQQLQEFLSALHCKTEASARQFSPNQSVFE